jgi:hypothetical protein
MSQDGLGCDLLDEAQSACVRTAVFIKQRTSIKLCGTTDNACLLGFFIVYFILLPCVSDFNALQTH